MYPGDGVAVGSVGWLPNDPHTATATTDGGRVHLFDVRTHLSKPAVVYDTGKVALYGHDFLDDYIAILGFGDGTVQVLYCTTRSWCIFSSPRYTLRLPRPPCCFVACACMRYHCPRLGI